MSHNKTLAGRPVISSTGLFTPAETITNEELVDSFNRYVERFNAENADAIAAGDTAALQPSSVEFIEKASGIKARHVMAKEPILDPGTMEPRLPERSNEELSFMAEIGVKAARQALEQAGRDVADVDAVLCAASNMQRPYPAMAIEIQQALGIDGFAFDMNVACSSATFGIQTAADYIRSGNAKSVLVVSPEITSGHLNWRDRDSHFIFGDACTAVVLENSAVAVAEERYEILGTRLSTKFSNAIRNNAGFLNRVTDSDPLALDKLFVQEGRRVFKEVCPMVAKLISDHLASLELSGSDLKRMWLHQANRHMNDLIARKVLGYDPSETEAPIILDRYANTSSAGSIIAFHLHREQFNLGDIGVICSFGAGYSAGSIVIRRA